MNLTAKDKEKLEQIAKKYLAFLFENVTEKEHSSFAFHYKDDINVSVFHYDGAWLLNVYSDDEDWETVLIEDKETK